MSFCPRLSTRPSRCPPPKRSRSRNEAVKCVFSSSRTASCGSAWPASRSVPSRLADFCLGSAGESGQIQTQIQLELEQRAQPTNDEPWSRILVSTNVLSRSVWSVASCAAMVWSKKINVERRKRKKERKEECQKMAISLSLSLSLYVTVVICLSSWRAVRLGHTATQHATRTRHVDKPKSDSTRPE